MYRKQTEVNKAANAENHTSCIQNEWQQEKIKGGGGRGGGGGGGGWGIHSILSYDAEMEEGVHTGQVMQSALAGLAVVSRDCDFTERRFDDVNPSWRRTRRLLVDRMGVKLHSWSD